MYVYNANYNILCGLKWTGTLLLSRRVICVRKSGDTATRLVCLTSHGCKFLPSVKLGTWVSLGACEGTIIN